MSGAPRDPRGAPKDPHEDVVVVLNPDGTIESLAEDVDLGAFGTQKPARASRIHFDPVAQRWAVVLACGRLLGSYSTRAGAIAAEVAVLNAHLAAGTIQDVLGNDQRRVERQPTQENP